MERIKLNRHRQPSSSCSALGASAQHRPGDTYALTEVLRASLATAAVAVAATSASAQTIFFEGFENSWNGWFASNGVWQVGSPTSEPFTAFSGQSVAGTSLGAAHPGDTDSRLQSPNISLPNLVGNEELHVRYMSWFSYSGCDSGRVQVSYFDSSNGAWSAWEDVGVSLVSQTSWSLIDVDVTRFAGELVRLGFRHSAQSGGSGCSGSSWGWYVDDVSIEKTTPVFTGDFESGWDGWGTDRGIWEIGQPTKGPDVFAGLAVAGTALEGEHPSDTDGRLISPTVLLESTGMGQELHLRFRQWFSYSGCDVGYVQISTYDDQAAAWSSWSTVGRSLANTSPWSLKGVDLTPFAGRRARIAFYHTAQSGGSGCSGASLGWYIDEIEFVRLEPTLQGGFELGWEGWSADRGIWQIGAPTSGPGEAFAGDQAAATVLDGNHGPDTDSRLVSPSLRLPSVSVPDEVHLRFMQWFSYSGCDVGYVQVSEFDHATEAWLNWVTVGNATSGSSPWSLRDVDLTNYAGKVIRLAFYHTAQSGGSGCSGTSLGWYLDEIGIYCPQVSSYCVAAPNSVGPGALIGAQGGTSLERNDLSLTVQGAPANRAGLFFYGPAQIQVPFGDGFRCVGAGGVGTFRLRPIVTTDGSGSVVRPVDLHQPPFSEGQGRVTAGSTWNFQFWYRDPGGRGGTGFNLSNGLSATFCP